MDRPILLSGPPGVGKSALAPALAARLGVPCVDLDDVLAAGAGAPIAAMLRRDGEAAFRQRERDALGAILDARRPAVVSLGGGALTATALRRRALREAVVVTLDAPVESLMSRLRAGAPRPLLEGWRDPAGALRELLDARAGAYAEAHLRCPAPDADIEGTAARLAARLADPVALVVPLGTRTYRAEVRALTEEGFARAWSEGLPGATTVVGVTERRVAARCAWMRPALAAVTEDAWLALPPGESAKTPRNVARVWSHALARGADRRAALVCHGGGVVTDLGGFAAATLLRGVRYASVPTTLLAMVDAAVGGKTAVDLPEGKNLAGAFHHPSLVWADVAALRTLPARELRSGLAEVVKIALVRDPELLNDIERSADDLTAARDPATLARVVRRAVQAKIDVVAEDEREGGVRAVLNFGHTVGHGVEAASKYRLRHGECVAVGMRAALSLGVSLGATPPGLAARVGALLQRLGLPHRARVSRDEVLRAMSLDKKRAGGGVRFVIATGEGSATLIDVPLDAATRAVEGALETRLQA